MDENDQSNVLYILSETDSLSYGKDILYGNNETQDNESELGNKTYQKEKKDDLKPYIKMAMINDKNEVQSESNKSILFSLSIELENGNTVLLPVFKGQTAPEIISIFCSQYNLSTSLKQILLNCIQEKLDNFQSSYFVSQKNINNLKGTSIQ